VLGGETVGGRYELVSGLGGGGMGEVWLAHDRRLQRRVAVKVVGSLFASDRAGLLRFRMEVQWGARISHPNVVSILDFGDGERPWLVMEYLEGGSVQALTRRTVEVDRALTVIEEASRGLGAAHRLGIVHRDVKPGNILLSAERRAKLADFGIAASLATGTSTLPHGMMGSAHYLAPERIAGCAAGPESDIYALGIVLYELLTGVRPFRGGRATAVAIAHMDERPQPPSTIRPGIGPEVDAMVMRCLAKDPRARYRDGDDLAGALGLVRQGQEQWRRESQRGRRRALSPRPVSGTTASEATSGARA
jgi:eukaryotic-like serine/threonine-protein kinase